MTETKNHSTNTSELLDSFHQTTYRFANETRLSALSNLESKGLPSTTSEEYRFTPISKLLEKNIKWSTKITSSEISSIDQFLIPNLDATILVFVNGLFDLRLSKLDDLGSNFKIKTLTEAFHSDKEIIESHFGKLVDAEKDSFASLNSAFWQEGLFVQVAPDTIIEKPLFVLHINDASKEQVISHTRLLVIVERSSQLSIIEKFDSIGSNYSFHTFSEEIVVKEKAEFDYYKIQNDPGKIYQVANSTIHQSDASKVNTFTLTMDGQLIRNNFLITIDGENCESHFHGLYLTIGDTIADNHTVVDHRKPNSYSNEVYKGIMDGHSKGVFNGKIYVRPQAQKTNAFQSNRNILLGESSSINTKPQLEIWADDVKCSHGCTTGQLDEEALFYLQTRGIPYDSAKAMLLYAFAKDVLAPIKNETIKSHLDDLISMRLYKEV